MEWIEDDGGDDCFCDCDCPDLELGCDLCGNLTSIYTKIDGLELSCPDTINVSSVDCDCACDCDCDCGGEGGGDDCCSDTCEALNSTLVDIFNKLIDLSSDTTTNNFGLNVTLEEILDILKFLFNREEYSSTTLIDYFNQLLLTQETVISLVNITREDINVIAQNVSVTVDLTNITEVIIEILQNQEEILQFLVQIDECCNATGLSLVEILQILAEFRTEVGSAHTEILQALRELNTTQLKQILESRSTEILETIKEGNGCCNETQKEITELREIVNVMNRTIITILNIVRGNGTLPGEGGGEEDPKWKPLFLDCYISYAACEDYALSADCFCSVEDLYNGDCTCECVDITCYGIPWSNLTEVCSGHGICVRKDRCRCVPGYTGDECDLPV
jgi:hypothetical protein